MNTVQQTASTPSGPGPPFMKETTLSPLPGTPGGTVTTTSMRLAESDGMTAPAAGDTMPGVPTSATVAAAGVEAPSLTVHSRSTSMSGAATPCSSTLTWKA